ncbi:Mitochondrial Assembly of ribosomal Large Subunit [Caenorhabditis elegans]|uniref:Uncharacterized protein K12H4.2 n=1 Tax=Caenorhabditis elegans TaxID=6239 RepID=YM62_CAEEL|nr:Uncharacterized protein CELE_K12H4.2 [Caenorhabditis elegans]P34523.2 RecName: Full=Uncharacterized protein K12H4.2 [Caenorhabditis elegans]CCD71194.1 Uncharacterized protein CELE_K12H4.2 [Caenorhabditis elegans]|eukprot:NP_498757.2 Uncharacterized protein CELE_K12H4.2 [Caenorhabditis elegans]
MLTRFTRLRPILQLRYLAQNSHIEEEYFEELEPTGIISSHETSQEPPKRTGFRSQNLSEDADFVENVVGALTDQRAKDVFVVKSEETEMTPYTHKIICSAFNSRQASAISENLRSLLKIDGVSNGSMSHARRSTKRSNGWYVSEVERVQVHVMSEECREKYDLEAIWAGDDRILDEIDEEKQKILLPPRR